MRTRYGWMTLAVIGWVGSLGAPPASALPASAAPAAQEEQAEEARGAPDAQGMPAPGAPDARWEAFLGCWAPLAEGSLAAEFSAPLLCFRPLDDVSVVRFTVAGGEVTDEHTLTPDGTPRPVSRDGCAGAEAASWSEDGNRLYVHSTLRCDDTAGQREVAGVLAPGGAGTLVELESGPPGKGGSYEAYRMLEAADYPASLGELRDYSDEPTRLYAAPPLTLEAIVEAADVLPASLVKAMAFHLPTQRLHIDAAALLALDEAGVDDEVIDLVVAAAYPEKFDVALDPFGDGTGYADDPYYGSGSVSGYRGFGYGGFGYRGFGYGGYYSRYYSPYRAGGLFGPGYYRGGTIIIIDRDEAAGPRGIAVKGRGYTRPGPPGAGSSSERSGSTSTGGWSSGGDSGASSGGGGGDGGGATPRRARPKP